MFQCCFFFKSVTILIPHWKLKEMKRGLKSSFIHCIITVLWAVMKGTMHGLTTVASPFCQKKKNEKIKPMGELRWIELSLVWADSTVQQPVYSVQCQSNVPWLKRWTGPDQGPIDCWTGRFSPVFKSLVVPKQWETLAP